MLEGKATIENVQKVSMKLRAITEIAYQRAVIAYIEEPENFPDTLRCEITGPDGFHITGGQI